MLHFLRQELEAIGEAHRLQEDASSEPWLPAQLVARLAEQDWPGNVRQLGNVVRELVISGRGARQVRMGPQVEKLLRSSSDHSPTPRAATAPTPEEPRRYRRPSEIGEAKLVAVLRRHRWRLKPTAAELGISRGSLYDLIRKTSSIRTAADVGRDEIEACLEQSAGDLEVMVNRLQVSKEGLRRRLKELGLARDG